MRKRAFVYALAALLAGVLAMGGLTGCGPKDDPGVIRVLCVENYTRIGEDQSTPVTLALEKKFGKKFQFIVGANHPEVSSKLGQLVNGNNVPDLVIGQTVDINKFPRSFLNLKDYENKMPNLFSYVNEPDVKRFVERDDGSIINCPTIVELRIQVAYIIRTDWLDNLGLPIPETFKQFEDTMYAFAKDDPGQTGIRNTIGFAQIDASWELQFAGNFKGSCQNILRNGELVYGPTEPQYRETLQYLNKLYSDGVLNPEFATTDIDKFQQLVASGRVGFTRAFFNRLEDVFDWSRTSDPNATWAIILPPILSDGKRYEQYQTNRVGNFGIAINKNSSKKDTLVEMVDYLYSEEGRLLTSFGVEGETYDMVGGKPVFKNIVTNHPRWKDSRSVKWYFGIEPQQHFSMVQDRSAFIYRPEVMAGIELCESNFEMYDNIPETPPVMLNINYSASERQAALVDWYEIERRMQEQSYRFIMGQRSFSDWDKFMGELNSLGLSTVMKTINDAYKRVMA